MKPSPWATGSSVSGFRAAVGGIFNQQETEVDMVGDREFYERLSEHHAKMLEGVDKSLDEFRKSRTNNNDKYLNGQIKYFEHVKSALNWSTRIALQKAESTDNVNRPAV